MSAAKVYSIDGVTPVVHPSAYVHPSAVLIGDVWVGAGCYIGPCACLRGDFGRIEVRAGANVQDTCVLHGFPGTDTLVEEEGHIGHGAVLHSCVIRRGALVGMNAIVHDNAVVGEASIVAAMAFVKAGMVIPPRSLVAGVPAKVLRELTEKELEWKVTGTRAYQELALRSLHTMTETTALPEAPPNRPRLELSEVLPLSDYRRRV